MLSVKPPLLFPCFLLKLECPCILLTGYLYPSATATDDLSPIPYRGAGIIDSLICTTSLHKFSFLIKISPLPFPLNICWFIIYFCTFSVLCVLTDLSLIDWDHWPCSLENNFLAAAPIFLLFILSRVSCSLSQLAPYLHFVPFLFPRT